MATNGNKWQPGGAGRPGQRRAGKSHVMEREMGAAGSAAEDSGYTEASQSVEESEISEDSPQEAVLSGKEDAFLMACKTAALLQGLTIGPKDSANDLLCSMLAKRDPTRFSTPDGAADALVAKALSACGGKSAPHNRDFDKLIGASVHYDPYLDDLDERRKSSLCPGSVRQLLPDKSFGEMQNEKVAAISIGDIIVYEEKGYRGRTITSDDGDNLVLAAVVAIVAQPTSRKEAMNVKLQVRRLYQFHELIWIFDQIAPYRSNAKLKDVSFWAKPKVSLAKDDDYIQAKAVFDDMRAKLRKCFDGFSGMHHKVIVAAVSDFELVVSAEVVDKVLPHTLCPAMLENVGSTKDSTWPDTIEDAKEMMCARTVVWKTFLRTQTWTLHPISLKTSYMQNVVFCAACRAGAWISRSIMQGMVGVVRRYIDSRVRQLGGGDGKSRQAVLSVPCSFHLFAYLAASARMPDLEPFDGEAVSIVWEQKTRSWNVRYQECQYLNSVLGRNWGSYCLANGRIVQVDGPVVMRYFHDTPDKMRFTMTRVRFGAVGGMDVVVEPREDEEAVDQPF